MIKTMALLASMATLLGATTTLAAVVRLDSIGRLSTIDALSIEGMTYDATVHYNLSWDELQDSPVEPITFDSTDSASAAAFEIARAVTSNAAIANIGVTTELWVPAGRRGNQASVIPIDYGGSPQRYQFFSRISRQPTSQTPATETNGWVTFSRVPEPGALLLVSVAAFQLLIGRRRSATR